MKKYLLIASGLVIIGLSACQKDTDSAIVSNNATTTASVTNPKTSDAPVDPAQSGTWQISSFMINGEDQTSNFKNNTFSFDADNVLTVTTPNGVSKGSWTMSDSGMDPAFMTLQMDPTLSLADALNKLGGTWTIIKSDTNDKLQLSMDKGAKGVIFVQQ